MLSQIHKRNNGNKEHTLSIIDGMVEMVPKEKPTQSHYSTADIIQVSSTDLEMERNKGYNQALSDLTSLLLAQREIIKKE